MTFNFDEFQLKRYQEKMGEPELNLDALKQMAIGQGGQSHPCPNCGCTDWDLGPSKTCPCPQVQVTLLIKLYEEATAGETS
jgi:hypothetical protein